MVVGDTAFYLLCRFVMKKQHNERFYNLTDKCEKTLPYLKFGTL